VFLLADEFSDTLDAAVGIKAILLLTHLGYQVILPFNLESGRTYLSKGLVRKARQLANGNVELLSGLVSGEAPLVGIEPSTLLTFRDEYPELVRPELREAARSIASHALLLDEFIAREIRKGMIISEQFTTISRKILLHGHCYQKVLSSTSSTKEMLSLPPNYEVEEIKSGCCGMAGAFGYEKEHYDLSMKVGELMLFPAVRNAGPGVIIAAPGTSCRHQIRDGTGRQAFHPVEILYDALL
jgi:Fe-S oxidoreductase